MNKISPKTELLVSTPSGKDRPALVPIPHTLIPLIQNNPPTCSFSPFLSYKSTFLSSTPESKKPIVKIEENDDINSDIEM